MSTVGASLHQTFTPIEQLITNVAKAAKHIIPRSQSQVTRYDELVTVPRKNISDPPESSNVQAMELEANQNQ